MGEREGKHGANEAQRIHPEKGGSIRSKSEWESAAVPKERLSQSQPLSIDAMPLSLLMLCSMNKGDVSN